MLAEGIESGLRATPSGRRRAPAGCASYRRDPVVVVALAEAADTANTPDGMSLPKELKFREDRLAAMASAKAKIAARAQERYTREKAEFDEKMSKREAKQKKTGNKPRGKAPTPPEPGAKDMEQINLTDEESRIMKVSGGGFEQCYNAQAAVDAQTMLVVATGLTQAPKDALNNRSPIGVAAG